MAVEGTTFVAYMSLLTQTVAGKKTHAKLWHFRADAVSLDDPLLRDLRAGDEVWLEGVACNRDATIFVLEGCTFKAKAEDGLRQHRPIPDYSYPAWSLPRLPMPPILVTWGCILGGYE